MRVLNARSSLLVLFSAALLLSATPNHTLGPWGRASEDPIISPQGDGWESAGTFNPAVVRHQGTFVMLYRAQGRGRVPASAMPRARMAFTSSVAPQRFRRCGN